jgi:uncharacterized pyridoxamine 5'-phosphate oxidase family protein
MAKLMREEERAFVSTRSVLADFGRPKVRLMKFFVEENKNVKCSDTYKASYKSRDNSEQSGNSECKNSIQHVRRLNDSDVKAEKKIGQEKANWNFHALRALVEKKEVAEESVNSIAESKQGGSRFDVDAFQGSYC